jgi:hypothetical protein
MDLFLEQRKKDDPPPPPPLSRRKSSLSGRKLSISGRKNAPATTDGANDNSQANSGGGGETLQVPNLIPKLSAYLRRKSESYLSRRRSDDYRTQRQQSRDELVEIGAHRTGVGSPRVHIESVQEENEPRAALRQNLSQRHLLKNDEVFL